MSTFTHGKTAGQHLAHEADPLLRKTVTVLTGRSLAAGSLLALITLGAITGAAGSNTGNGTLGTITRGAQTQAGAYTLRCTAAASGAITTAATGTAGGGNAGANTMTAVSAGAAVKAGTYTATCTDATNAGAEIYQVTDPDGLLLAQATVAVAYVNAQIHFTINDPGANAQVGDTFTVLASAAAGNAGTFAVFAPSGARLADLTVGAAYAGDHFNVTLADGSTDFAVGDTFTLTVAAGSSKAVLCDPAATNGSQHPIGFLHDAVDATSADADGVAVVRDAVIKASEITWAGGTTSDQKTALAGALAPAGLYVRTDL